MPITLDYPGQAPGTTTAKLTDSQAVLENNVISCSWSLDAGKLGALTVANKSTDQTLSIASGCMPRLSVGDGRRLDLSCLQPSTPIALDKNAVVAVFNDAESGLELTVTAALQDNVNAIVYSLQITATQDARISDLKFVEAAIEGARQMGEVAGSVVVCDTIFLGIENPLARNLVDDTAQVTCALPLNNRLRPGTSWCQTFAVGVSPADQLRRGFGYYIDRRRAHPYRPFLHYNNWYDVWLGRPVERVTEQECLDAIEYFGQELVQKRHVKMDAVVWDDGWDDFNNSIWKFHVGFPDGFRNLMTLAERYGMDQGVWMSPNGGFAAAKDKRVVHGIALGYETNERGFAMSGPVYAKAFRETCLGMMRDNGVVFFKFDGMGDGGSGDGGTDVGKEVKLSDDINGVLELSQALRAEKEDVYISATTGTWASPYWLLFADSIWRQGGDSGHHGEGNTRQQWITYRDMFTHNRVVKAGPLYPINSLMLHGILIGDGRPGRAPSGMLLDETSVADEIWTFFGSGTCLQELYISPNVMSETMLDQLANAANWARANADTLIDTHWVGGNPEHAEVYGWASWKPSKKGILVLRNPSSEVKTFSITPKDALELPEGVEDAVTPQGLYPIGRELPAGPIATEQAMEFTLQPFETIAMELQ